MNADSLSTRASALYDMAEDYIQFLLSLERTVLYDEKNFLRKTRPERCSLTLNKMFFGTCSREVGPLGPKVLILTQRYFAHGTRNGC